MNMVLRWDLTHGNINMWLALLKNPLTKMGTFHFQIKKGTKWLLFLKWVLISASLVSWLESSFACNVGGLSWSPIFVKISSHLAKKWKLLLVANFVINIQLLPFTFIDVLKKLKLRPFPSTNIKSDIKHKIPHKT